MAKLKTPLLVSAGFVLGFAAGELIDWLNNAMTVAYQEADHSITLTYVFAEQNTLRAESDVLKAMAEPHWVGLPADLAKEQLELLGIYEFTKGSEGFAAGPVFLRLQDDTVFEIQAHCARMKSDGCKDEGVN